MCARWIISVTKEKHKFKIWMFIFQEKYHKNMWGIMRYSKPYSLKVVFSEVILENDLYLQWFLIPFAIYTTHIRIVLNHEHIYRSLRVNIQWWQRADDFSPLANQKSMMWW